MIKIASDDSFRSAVAESYRKEKFEKENKLTISLLND